MLYSSLEIFCTLNLLIGIYWSILAKLRSLLNLCILFLHIIFLRTSNSVKLIITFNKHNIYSMKVNEKVNKENKNIIRQGKRKTTFCSCYTYTLIKNYYFVWRSALTRTRELILSTEGCRIAIRTGMGFLERSCYYIRSRRDYDIAVKVLHYVYFPSSS